VFLATVAGLAVRMLGLEFVLLRALTRALALSSEAKQYVRRPRAFVSSFFVNYESVG
jgi:hypothetical protein